MRQVRDFTASPCCLLKERQGGSRLYFEGTDTGLFVPGGCLEAQFDVGDLWIFILTDDCPYEDGIHVVAVNKYFSIIDRIYMVSPYGTGVFKLISVSVHRTLVFKFFNDILYEIDVFGHPKLCLPFISDPRGVWRRLGFYRWFKVRVIGEMSRD